MCLVSNERRENALDNEAYRCLQNMPTEHARRGGRREWSRKEARYTKQMKQFEQTDRSRVA